MNSDTDDTAYEIKEAVIQDSRDLTPPPQGKRSTAALQYDDIRTTFLENWKLQQAQDRKYRGTYATELLTIFKYQLGIMYLVLLLIAFGMITLTDSQFTVFFVSAFAEIAALLGVATKYLFSENGLVNIVELFKDP